MAENRNFAALDWLIHEIGETLKEARQALEAYVENPKDAVRIRFCLTHIHQVHGSLQMVEFFGAAMLAEEMERLTQAMIQGSVANAAEAQEVLMRAILQFPVYLDQVKATRKDNPLVVLPLLNDLRAVRGESLLTDTKLFVPNLAPAKKVTGPRSPAAQDNVQFQAMALKLRQMYQYAAAGFIRNVNSDENLAYLQKVFNRLHKLTQGTARHALWDICLALAEALEIDALEISVAIKNLLRQLDKEIKILAVHGTKALNSYTNDELIKNLLYYVARAGKHAPGFTPNSHLQRIYETYHLDEALIEGKESGSDSDNILSTPDSDAMRSVVEALKTELDIIKHALDVCLSGGDAATALGEALPVVKRIGDTMAVLGLGDLRKQVLEQGAALELVAHSNSQMTNDQLMSIAGKVIEIEDALDGLAQQQSSSPNSQLPQNEGDITLTRAKESVLRESRNGLEHAKDAIIEYIASQWDRVHLQNVPETLREIRGGLEIMPLPRAARILGACARYIEEQLLQQEFTPQWSSLDTLADAITSVEYYLEKLSSDSTREENDLLLSVAEESVAALGYAVAKVSRPDAAAELVAARPKSEPIQTTHEAAEADEASLAAAYESVLQPEPETQEPDVAPVAEAPVPAAEEKPAQAAANVPGNLLRGQAPSIGNRYPQPATTVMVSGLVAGIDLTIGNKLAVAAPVLETPTTETSESGVVPEEIIAELPEVEASAPVEAIEPVEEIIELDLDLPEIGEPAPALEPVAEEVVDLGSYSVDEVIEDQADQPAAAAVEASDEEESDIDDEIIEIFVEEAGEVSETIAQYFPRWAKNFEDMDALTEFRRAFHTLKGSGRMVGANDIGELAWSIENMLNRVLDKTITPGAPHIAIIEKVCSLLPDMIEAFSLHKPNPTPELSEHYRGLAESLSKGVVPDELADGSQPVVEAGEESDVEVIEAVEPESVQDEEIEEDEEILLELPEPVVEAPAVVSQDYTSERIDEDDSDDGDAQLWDIFGAEAETHLQTVQEFIAHMEAEAPVYEPPSDSIQRALHTLKGSAHMAEITPIAELAAPLEKFVKELRSYHVVINDDMLQLLRDAVSYTQAGLAQIEHGQTVDIPRLHQFIARVNELREIHVAPLVRQQELDEHGKRPVDPELLSIFMAEEMNLLLDADQIVARWQATPNDKAILQPVFEELRKLTLGAQHAYLPPMARLAEKLEHVYSEILAGRLGCTEALCQNLNSAHVALLDMVDAIAAGQNLAEAPDHIHHGLDDLLALAQTPVAEPEPQVPVEVQETAELEAPDLTEAYAADDEVLTLELDDVDDSVEEVVYDTAAAFSPADLATQDEQPFELVDEALELDETIDLGDYVSADSADSADQVTTLDLGEITPDFDHIELEDADTAEEITLSAADFITSTPSESPSLDEETLHIDMGDPLVNELDSADEELSLDMGDASPEEIYTELVEPAMAEYAAEPAEETVSLPDEDVQFESLALAELQELPEQSEAQDEAQELTDLVPESLAEDETLIDFEIEDEPTQLEEAAFELVDEEDQLDEVELLALADAMPVAEELELDEDQPELEIESELEDEELSLLDATADEELAFEAEEGEYAELTEPVEALGDADLLELEDEALDEDAVEAAISDADALVEEELEAVAATPAPVAPVVKPAPVIPPKAVQPKPVASAVDDEDFDPEIVEIFIEEATELLEDMERALHDWQEDWNNTDCVEELKRCLHTFKGGARLAGLTDLGDLSHNFETVLIDMDSDTDIDQNFFRELNSYQDRLHAGVSLASAKLSGNYVAPEEEQEETAGLEQEDYAEYQAAYDEAAGEEAASVDAGVEQEEIAEHDAPAPVADYHRPALVVDNDAHRPEPGQKPNILTFAPKPKPPAAPLPKIPGSEFGGARQVGSGPGQVQHLATRRAGPQEVVKVSAELLEELVNLAGETSISRGRMEQQVSDLSGSIEEMDATIHRLQEQLRRLDIETEAQVLFRQEQMAQHEEFDPLEMDRYSQLQQLSRSLIESASDLMDLKYTLADKTRDTETLLLQQSRINTDLQEGLMRSRMVPFSRLVPRLRRIVRQAADELGKEVNFELDNVEGELDRTVLERMVAPLEHMLRNAVDHGIESPDAREAAGKPAVGRISLSLGREGGDVMLRLSDDGRGINLQRVREKAIERGLMAEDAPLSDQDLMQFILHAGFSTADKVTQISGRGVGMDVVHSEIKQLGGAMFIDSRWGEGTEFVIRLPFTVSVNRALMVQIGDDLYAIPLNTIEGIVRVSPFELEHYYQDPEARFDYAGDNYLVRYLGTLLDSEALPKLDGQSLPLPVILVRSTENTVALQVDRLLGSREIVVKTLGAQFSAVRGVSGATVMGDGSVVVILDLHALIREQLALGLGHAMLLEPIQIQPAEEDQVEKTVMVVDDSVTVRKVTGRFLEREGFRVITAKDGVEALQLLQDHIPDVMLLDIEMPRMDGFEVAKNIRTSSRLREIPIIMITSRTGEKHRERAFELGVNKYMGKPYQEDLLLTNIQELIKKPVK